MTAAEAAPAAEATPDTVRWVYGGQRVSEGGKAFHAWYGEDDPQRLDLTSSPHAFLKVKGHVIGGIYQVTVTERTGDGEVRAVLPSPSYTGERVADREYRAALEAAHFAAGMQIAAERTERRHAKDSALEDALAPLLVISGQMRTRAERAAFTQYVVRRLGSGWS